MDYSTPHITRFQWPKEFAPLTEEQQAISDDFMQKWHEVLPQRYDVVERFNHGYPLRIMPKGTPIKTLELGAGLGGHLPFEALDQQDYTCIELRPAMADHIRSHYPQVKVITGDIQQRLPFDDQSFDRILAIHVLEHLPNLPATIAEVARLLKPDGLFSIVIPCDPGLAYSVARKISAERLFRSRYKLPYGWLIRREHINSPAEIFSLLDQRFQRMDESYFPLRLPFVHLNLCIGATMKLKPR
jgi:SAM-dependent methyltransferase